MKHYYIMNRYQGDFFIFWRDGGHGYTTDLNQAWLVPEDQAHGICSDPSRGDYMIDPVIAAKASLTVVDSELYAQLGGKKEK